MTRAGRVAKCGFVAGCMGWVAVLGYSGAPSLSPCFHQGVQAAVPRDCSGRPAKSAEREIATSQQTARNHNDAVAASAAAILARPLFAQSRRPPRGPAVKDGAGTQAMPRLAGIVIVANYRQAIFESAGAQPMSVGEDGTVAGWRVSHIEASSVGLQRGGVRLSLTPSLLAGVLPPLPARDPWVTPRATGILRARWSNSQYQP